MDKVLINTRDGDYFYVSESISKFISTFSWKTQRHKNGKSFYFYTTINSKKIYLHRLIFIVGKHFQVDHKNIDPRDNTYENLREATSSQNCVNHKRKSKYGYPRGVFRNRKKFKAVVTCNYVAHRSASFDTVKEAAIAYNEMAIKYHGEFAVLNDIEEL